MSPSFPVIVIYESGLMFVENQRHLQESTLGFLGPLVLEDETVIDITGQTWKPIVEKKPSFNLNKFLRVMRGHTETTDVTYSFKKQEIVSLPDLKSLIIEYSENDSGDLMQQFISHSEIVSGTEKSKNYIDLFVFINDFICGDKVA